MAEVEITVQDFGANPNFVAADAGGHLYINDGISHVLVENLSGSQVTCDHIESTDKQCDYGHAAVNTSVDCPTGGITAVWGGKHKYRFNSASNGKSHFTISSVSGVRVAVISYEGV